MFQRKYLSPEMQLRSRFGLLRRSVMKRVQTHAHLLFSHLLLALATAPFLIMPLACSSEAPPMSHLQQHRDSTALMTTYGVSKMISDSGIMRYRIIAEEWQLYDKTQPPRQEFPRGIFLERLDNNFKMDLYIIADSAWCYDQSLWRLKGKVYILDKENDTRFWTEELFWDMNEHRFYSNKYMRIRKPDREMEGNRFTANEQLTQYHIWQSKGFMPVPKEKKKTPSEPTMPPANE